MAHGARNRVAIANRKTPIIGIILNIKFAPILIPVVIKKVSITRDL